MKDVLILGAGMMVGPVVEFLGRDESIAIHVAALQMHPTTSEIVDAVRNADFHAWNADDNTTMQKMIQEADLVISLMPANFHAYVARLCITEGKSMVTASYVSREMRALDESAKQADVLLLNECGVDPGIDHMSAMKVIDSAHRAGKKIRSFQSFTGGLPAPDANNNPWGYKVSWSQRSVVTAATNGAHYLQDGRDIVIPPEKLFTDVRQLEFDNLGTLETYPNRDSISYIDLYGLHTAKTMFRGTLRYPGWCTLWDAIVRLGMLENKKPIADTYTNYMLGLVEGQGDVRQAVATFLGMSVNDPVIEKLAYIGFFDDRPIQGQPRDRIQLLANLIAKKLVFRAGERDLLVMRHIFDIEDDTQAYRLQSTMVQYGDPEGFSAMAKTVGLPVAIAADLVLKNRIPLTGVQIPTMPEIYEQVLPVLANEGVLFIEKTTILR